jgi:hypothetical protein
LQLWILLLSAGCIFQKFLPQLLAQMVSRNKYIFTPVVRRDEAMSSCDWMTTKVQLLAGRRDVYLAGAYLTGPSGLDEGGARTLRAYYCDSQEDLSRFLRIFHALYFDDIPCQLRWTCENKSACAVALARKLWLER